MTQYQQYQNQVETALATAIPKGIPSPLFEAMEYSLLSPGKRLRSILLLAAYAMVKEDVSAVMPFATSIEMIHAYSLIHDDLPALDNDDFRRGKPSNHKVFGEDIAILAGDALLNLAYETMLSSNHKNALQAALVVAKAAGVLGMIKGQVLDVVSEGVTHSLEDAKTLLTKIHENKTAKLITAPLHAGLLLADASQNEVEHIISFGKNIGIAFQIIDDLLDVIGNKEVLGKSVGKDSEADKLTWTKIYGIEKSREHAKQYTQSALEALACFGERADFLRKLATDMLQRVH